MTTPRVTVPVEAVGDMRDRARYLREYAPIVSAAMYGGENPSGIWNLNRAADLLDQAANALSAAPAPVEDLAGKLKAIRDKFLMPTPDKDFTDYAIMTRCVEHLSAAPAPEGGAVSVAARALLDACIADFGDPKDFPDDDGWVASGDKGDSAVTFKHMRDLQSALATREEAPAEAGELDSAIKRMRNQLVGSATFTQLMFGREDVRLVLDTLSALRAQPQAREDAQPVGPVFFTDSQNPEDRWVTQEYPDGSCSISERHHPAPDALREAVEALEEIADTDPDDGTSWFHERANQALAALQAEQGAK